MIRFNFRNSLRNYRSATQSLERSTIIFKGRSHISTMCWLSKTRNSRRSMPSKTKKDSLLSLILMRIARLAIERISPARRILSKLWNHRVKPWRMIWLKREGRGTNLRTWTTALGWRSANTESWTTAFSAKMKPLWPDCSTEHHKEGRNTEKLRPFYQKLEDS